MKIRSWVYCRNDSPGFRNSRILKYPPKFSWSDSLENIPIYEKRFQVRHYECDARGLLSQAVILRYMQESAYEASASLGYGMLAYKEADRSWYIRETDISFEQDVWYGEKVMVRTWVKDFHRVRSIRAYNLFAEDGKTRIARAQSDWVFLEQSTGKPRSIPLEMIRAFRPDWTPGKIGERRRSLPGPGPAKNSFRCTRHVEWRDLDPVQHVNNSIYLNYLEDCGLQAERAAGWPLERLEVENLCIVSRRAQLEYKQSARFGDELAIETWLSEPTYASWKRYYRITRAVDGALILQAYLHQSWIDQARKEWVPIPEAAKTDFL
jgi:acyl-CoA thioester hydrolase